MVKRYQITYVLLNDPYRTKRSIWKFGTSVAELEKTFGEYIKDPAVIVEIVISDEDL